MEQATIDFEAARAARDAGMSLAMNHAERLTDGWGEIALSFIETYARSHLRFISEECTAAASMAGISSPADPRAWGSPFQRAARQGIICKVGFGISHRRHLSPTPLWESMIYKVAA